MKSQLLGFLAAIFFLMGAIVTTFISFVIYENITNPIVVLDPWALLGIITLGPIGLILLILGIILFTKL